MKAIVKKCIDCLSEIPAEARKCSHCGSAQEKPSNTTTKEWLYRSLVVLFLFIMGSWIYAAMQESSAALNGRAYTSPAERVMKNNQATVASDFERQYYDVVNNGGTMIDKCVRAGLVAEGYLQAGDQTNYTKWQAQRSRDCKSAGVPF